MSSKSLERSLSIRRVPTKRYKKFGEEGHDGVARAARDVSFATREFKRSDRKLSAT